MQPVDAISFIMNTSDVKIVFVDGNKSFRSLSRLVHPDMFLDDDLKSKASEAFIKLNHMWTIFNNNGSTPVASNVIKTRKHDFVVGDKTADFDGFVTYDVTFDAGHQKASLTYAKNGADNDLTQNFGSTLRDIRSHVPDEYKMFFPQVVENFRSTQNGKEKFFVVTQLPDFEFYTLRQVVNKYKTGVDAKDVAWMFRRMMVAVGNAHDLGFVHNASTVDAFLIQPEHHGVVLTNWQYSTKIGDKLTALPMSHKGLYPEWVFDTKIAVPEVDFAVISGVCLSLLDVHAPKALRSFFKGCRVKNLPSASELLGEFDELLYSLWGERKFHKFTM